MKINLLFIISLLLLSQDLGAFTGSEFRSNDRLLEIIRDISIRYNVHFTYDREIVEDVEVANYTPEAYASVDEALSQVLAGTKLKYVMLEMKYVIIYQDDAEGMKSLEQMVEVLEQLVKQNKEKRFVPPLSLLESSASFQNIYLQKHRMVLDVSGIVTDQAGEPLIGVNVMVQGTTKGTATDFDGRFTLEDVNEKTTLIFSYVGYQSQEIALNGRSDISVIMIEDSQTLEEVVVVGYGTQKRINLTGSVSTVGRETLEDRGLVSVTEALQGAAANVNIMESNLGGEPGVKRNINIRGIGTLTGDGGRPYVLVDGMPMDLDDVNPNDIESISVLKDAAASAIYGSRAPFGVILINTKKGKNEKFNINYRYNYSLSHPTAIAKFASSIESVISHQYMTENSGVAGYSEELVQRVFDYYNGVIDNETVPIFNKPNEWGFSPASGANANNDVPSLAWDHWNPQQNHYISASGAQSGVNYHLSGGFFNQGDVMAWGDEFYKRYDFSTNLNSKLSDWLSLDFNIKYNREKTQRPVASKDNPRSYQWGWVYTNTPLHALYAPNGDLLFQLARENEFGGRENHDIGKYWMKIGGELEPIPGWKTNVSYSWKNQSGRSTLHKKTVYYPLVDGTEYVWRYPIPSFEDILNSEKFNIFNIYTTYGTAFKGHSFDILLGFEDEYSENNLFGGMKTDVISPEVPSISTSSGEFTEQASWDHWATAGFFARFNYNFNDKYLLELNGRYDGSSRFEGASKQWGLFPSMSLGYVLSKESFWTPVYEKLRLDFFKIRASIGSLGNQNIGNYKYLPIIGTNSNLDWVIGSSRPNYTTAPPLVSPGLTWETAQTLDFGVDFSFFDSRLNFNFDVFTRTTKDMFGPAEKLPAILGTTPALQNNSELVTNGFDLSINFKGNIRSQLNYSLSFILGDTKSKITKYNNPTGLINYNINGDYSWYEGGVVGDIWGFVTEKVFMTNAEAEAHVDQSYLYNRWSAGDIGYLDLNNDGKIDIGKNTLDDHGDLKIIGNIEPRYQFGFNTFLEYKNFDLNVFLQGVGKRDYFFYGGGRVWSRFWGFRGQATSKGLTEYTADYWTPEGSDFGGGPDAYFPKPYASSEYVKNIQTQTRYLQNAAYLRLKNIRLGYNVNSQLLNKLFMDKLNVFISGNNILTITKLMQKFDPEALANDPYEGGQGTTVYPLQKAYTIGINVTF